MDNSYDLSGLLPEDKDLIIQKLAPQLMKGQLDGSSGQEPEGDEHSACVDTFKLHEQAIFMLAQALDEIQEKLGITNQPRSNLPPATHTTPEGKQRNLRALCHLCVCPKEDEARSHFLSAFFCFFSASLCLRGEISLPPLTQPLKATSRALCHLCVCPKEDEARSHFLSALFCFSLRLCASAVKSPSRHSHNP